MSDKMRWRYGDTNPVVAAVHPATVIEIGDLLWQDVNNAKSAAAMDCPADEGAANQALFTDKFLGVAMQRSRNDDEAPIRVATTGVFEFDCPSGTFELGDLVGVGVQPSTGMEDAPDKVTPLCLLNQQIVAVTSDRYAIARVAKRELCAIASVLVDIRSTIMTGGVTGRSPSGV